MLHKVCRFTQKRIAMSTIVVKSDKKAVNKTKSSSRSTIIMIMHHHLRVVQAFREAKSHASPP